MTIKSVSVVVKSGGKGLTFPALEPLWLVGAGVAVLVVIQTAIIVRLYRMNRQLGRRLERLKKRVKKSPPVA